MSTKYVFILLLALAAGCSSTDARRQVIQGPPAPLVLAVLEPAGVRDPDSGEVADVRLELDAFVREMRALDAASLVIAASDLSEGEQADYYVRPRVLSEFGYEHEGVSDDFWASGGLWLITWVGGLFVEDSTYQARWSIDYEILPDAQGADPIRTQQTVGGPLDLSFFERNDLLSWGTFMSLVLPPFWTVDDEEKTAGSVASKAVSASALDLTRALKLEFADMALSSEAASLTSILPANGATVSDGRVRLKIGLQSRGTPIGGVLMRHNDADLSVKQTDMTPEEGLETTYRATVEADLVLQPGDNLIKLEFETNQVHRRTLRYRLEQRN